MSVAIVAKPALMTMGGIQSVETSWDPVRMFAETDTGPWGLGTCRDIRSNGEVPHAITDDKATRSNQRDWLSR